MEKANEVNTLTKECILTALLRLMKEKPYPSISITDITKLAGVSRMAYYRNYSSKDEILFSRLEDEEKKILKEFEDESVDDMKEVIYQAASFYQQNCDVISAIYSAGLSDMLSKMLEDRIRFYFPIIDSLTEGKYAMHFYTGAITQVLKYWVDSDFEITAESVSELICKFIDKDSAIKFIVHPD